jgi:hypothetical protein
MDSNGALLVCKSPSNRHRETNGGVLQLLRPNRVPMLKEKQMSYDVKEEFQNYLSLWALENHSPDWPQYKSPDALRLLRNKAASFGGLISVSHFIRAFAELKASGEIKQLRQPRSSVDVPELTREQYNKLSAADITRRYRADRDFRAQVDALIARGEI